MYFLIAIIISASGSITSHVTEHNSQASCLAAKSQQIAVLQTMSLNQYKLDCEAK